MRLCGLIWTRRVGLLVITIVGLLFGLFGLDFESNHFESNHFETNRLKSIIFVISDLFLLLF